MELLNKNSEYFPQFYKYYIYQTNEVKYLTASAADKFRGICLAAVTGWTCGYVRPAVACGNKINVKRG